MSRVLRSLRSSITAAGCRDRGRVQCVRRRRRSAPGHRTGGKQRRWSAARAVARPVRGADGSGRYLRDRRGLQDRLLLRQRLLPIGLLRRVSVVRRSKAASARARTFRSARIRVKTVRTKARPAAGAMAPAMGPARARCTRAGRSAGAQIVRRLDGDATPRAATARARAEPRRADSCGAYMCNGHGRWLPADVHQRRRLRRRPPRASTEAAARSRPGPRATPGWRLRVGRLRDGRLLRDRLRRHVPSRARSPAARDSASGSPSRRRSDEPVRGRGRGPPAGATAPATARAPAARYASGTVCGGGELQRRDVDAGAHLQRRRHCLMGARVVRRVHVRGGGRRVPRQACAGSGDCAAGERRAWTARAFRRRIRRAAPAAAGQGAAGGASANDRRRRGRGRRQRRFRRSGAAAAPAGEGWRERRKWWRERGKRWRERGRGGARRSGRRRERRSAAGGGTRGCPGYAFCDDFEDGDADGWASIGGTWSVIADGGSVYRGANGSGNAIAGTATWTDQTVEARVKVPQFGAEPAVVRGGIARARPTTSVYVFASTRAAPAPAQGDQPTRRGTRRQRHLRQGTPGPAVAANAWHTMKIRCQGASNVPITTFLDGAIHDCQTSAGTMAAGAPGTYSMVPYYCGI